MAFGTCKNRKPILFFVLSALRIKEPSLHSLQLSLESRSTILCRLSATVSGQQSEAFPVFAFTLTFFWVTTPLLEEILPPTPITSRAFGLSTLFVSVHIFVSRSIIIRCILVN